MRIKKLQVGGVAPYMAYTGIPQAADTSAAATAPATSAAAATKEAEDEGLLSKEMMKLLMENGMPSDVQMVMGKIAKLQKSIDLGVATDTTAIMYKQIIPYLNKVKYESESMRDISAELNKNGGMNELAISTDGRVLVQTNEGLKDVSIDEYGKGVKAGTMRGLTNNDLRKLRAQSTGFAFNDDAMGILANGKGLQAVTKEMLEVINTLKENKETRDTFMSGSNAAVLNAFTDLSNMSEKEAQELYQSLGLSDDVMFKLTTEQSSNVDNKKAETVINYLYSMLPQNSLNLIQAKAAQTGQSASQIMLGLIMTGQKTDSSIKWTMSENDIEKARKNAKGGGGDISGATSLTFKQRIATNDYTKNKLSYTNFDDGTSRFSVPHFKINAFQDENGKTLNPNSSIDIICTDSLGEVADMGNVWLGNKRLTVEDQKRIAATGQNQAKVYMPLDMEALNRGEYKPNLEVAKMITAANDYIKNNNIETEEGKKEVYRDYGVDIYLEERNIENSPYFGAFLAVQSFTQGAYGMADKDSRAALREFDPKDKDIYLEAINRNINNGKSGKDKDWSAGWFRNKDLYEGMVYVHLNDDPIVASGASNNLNIAKAATTPNYIRTESNKNERRANINNARTGTNILDQ